MVYLWQLDNSRHIWQSKMTLRHICDNLMVEGEFATTWQCKAYYENLKWLWGTYWSE